MPLSDDQKAMLRLLARDQSYEDIAALMGLSVDEVVSRAQGAVAQLESEGIPAPTLPEASGVAPAKEPELAAKAPDPPKAEEEPPAEEPKPAPAPPKEPAPEAKKPAPPAATPPPSQPPAPRKQRDKGMLLAIGGGVVGVVVIIVLLVLLLSNSGGSNDPTTSKVPVNNGESTNAAQTQKPTTAQLVEVNGSGASGSATFGRVEEALGLGIRAQGLERFDEGNIYMVWLASSPQKMLPLTAVVANKAGRINASYQVPTEAVVYLATGEFDDLVITKANNKELRASLEAANEEKNFPKYTGDAVLEGTVEGPIIGAAKRLEERQKQRKEEAE